MRDHLSRWPLRVMCRALKASPSGYYAWSKRPDSARAQRRTQWRTAIARVHQQSRRTYGSPRVHAALQAEGQTCCLNTVARIMRAEGLQAKTKRKFKATTNSSHHLPVAENVLGRKFERSRANEAWVSDITYIPTDEGWLYLAATLDLYSRRIVGWAMSERMTSPLVIDALAMAIEQRRPPAGLIHHSDRGSQYASAAFQSVLSAHAMVCSMSRKGDCYDNAVMESFFGTLKCELVSFAGSAGRGSFATRAEARQAIFEWIEVFYNRQRLHSSLGHKSPANYEAAA
jgi:transposase InsO family protein